jgi:hypothetical protein
MKIQPYPTAIPLLGLMATLYVLLPAAAQSATLTTFTDKASFLASTCSTSATGPLPNLVPTSGPVTLGSATFTSLSGAMFFGALFFPETDWTTRLDGHDLAISGNEDFLVEFADPVTSFGFDFVEPQNDPNINAPFVDSTFLVSLFFRTSMLGSFTYNAPNDVAHFIGVHSDEPFDSVQFEEIVGSNENEFWGEFYTRPLTQDMSLALVSGPLKDDGLGGRTPFDIDDDSENDVGPVIGIGLAHAQGYAYEVQVKGTIPNPVSCDDPDLIVLAEIPRSFALDPDGEDFQFDGMIDGICGDSLPCDGIIVDTACPTSITESMDEDAPASAILLSETGGLAEGETCTTTVFLGTEQASGGKGRGSKSVKFEPVSCVTAVSDSGTPITDTISLSPGLKLFHGASSNLLAGPTGSIQLTPIGCP